MAIAGTCFDDRDSSGFNDSLNETGAFFWENMEQGIEKAALVDKMLERFDDLDRETAEKDLDEFVAKIRFALE